MCRAWFEKYSSTGETSEFKYAPVEINKNYSIVLNELIKRIETLKGENITINKDFLDIYYEKDGFQISYTLNQNEAGHTILNVHIFGEKKRGKTRKKLISELTLLYELFDKDIILN